MRSEDFLDAVRRAGVVGLGGAGFPAHVKYACRAEIVIANACECEPLLHSDIRLVEQEGDGILDALEALRAATGADRAVVAIKAKHTYALRVLAAPAAARGIEVVRVQDFYPAGDEQVLVREITGRTVPPLGLPGAVGALVANVGTLHAVSLALQGRSLTRRLVTVTGEVRRPGVLRVPLGTAVEECIAACGGALVKDSVVLVGGPMMGRRASPATGQTGGGEVITKTTGALLVLPADHGLVRAMDRERDCIRRRARSACIQCRLCTELCPRYLLGHPLEPHRIMRAFAAGEEFTHPVARQALLCCECGVCEKVACPMELAPKQVNALIKQALRRPANPVRSGPSSSPPDVPAPDTRLSEGREFWRAFRKVPTPRLVERLGLGAFKARSLPWLGDLEVAGVRIPLRQHIGAPAIPCCNVGDKVQEGDLVAGMAEGALGAAVHASICGTVVCVDDAICVRAFQK